MEQRCKKHPSHRQARGVCPSCLREKLSHLSSTFSSSTMSHSYPSTNSSLSPNNYYSDSNLSSVASPFQKSTKSFSSCLLGGDHYSGKPLKKSRSLVIVIEKRDKEKEKKKKGKGEKSGRRFWAKLMMGRRKEGEKKDDGFGGMLHYSKTVKEKTSSKWVLFS